MKKYIQHIVAFALIALFNTNTNAQVVTGVSCPTTIQEQTNWCWAACSKMVYWNYGAGAINQCDAANVSKNLEMNTGCGSLANSNLSACSSPLTFNSPQAMYGCTGSLQSILSNYGIASTSFASSLSAATVTTATNTKKLMIARWGWNNGGGHFVVINRYKAGNVYYNNPLSGAVIWAYNTFLTANGAGSWTHSLRMNNAAAYGTTLNRGANETPVKTIVNEFSLNMYPNPATEKVTILMNGEKNNDNNISITDITGKVIFTQHYTKDISSASINVASWNRGLYFVSVNGDRKLTKTLSLQ
jgi:hypothetical protein